MRAVVLEQPLSKAIGIDFASLQRIDVVIHLDVANAIFIHQPCDHLIEICPYLWISEVQQQPRILKHSLPMTHEEPVVRFLREHRLRSCHFGFKPKPRNHSSLSDLIEYKL